MWTFHENKVDTPLEEEGFDIEPMGDDNGIKQTRLKVGSLGRGWAIGVKSIDVVYFNCTSDWKRMIDRVVSLSRLTDSLPRLRRTNQLPLLSPML